jgi:hypothetical protein
MSNRVSFINEIGLLEIKKELDIVDLFKIEYASKNKNNKSIITGYVTTLVESDKIWEWEILLRSRKTNKLLNTIVIWGSKYPKLTEIEFKEIFENEIKVLTK